MLTGSAKAGQIPSRKQPISDNTGFREAMRKVIREQAGILRKDITAKLKRTGTQVRGRTPLSTRVYNDLWRMEKSGEVQRDSKGGYLIKEAAE